MPVDIESMTRPVLVVIGPSASGKSAAVRELARRDVVRVHPTWTTRAPRADETDGAIEHRFVTDDVFDRLEREEFFLGTVRLPGLPFRYALPRIVLRDSGPVDVVMARAPFIAPFASYFPHRVVYQVEDTRERAYARLVERGSAPGEIDARLMEHEREVEAGRALAARVFANAGTVDSLVDAMTGAITADFGAVRIASMQ